MPPVVTLVLLNHAGDWIGFRLPTGEWVYDEAEVQAVARLYPDGLPDSIPRMIMGGDARSSPLDARTRRGLIGLGGAVQDGAAIIHQWNEAEQRIETRTEA